MNSKTALIVFSILFSVNFYAQQDIIENYNTLLTEADSIALHDNHADAIAKYNELLNKENIVKLEPLLFNRLAQIYRKKGDFETATEYAEKALEMSQKLTSKNPLQEATALDNLGRISNHRATHEKSLDYHTRAFEIKKTIAKVDSSEFALSYFYIASVNQFMSKYDEALAYLDKALKIDLKPTSQNNIVISNIYQTLGRINYDLGLKDEALHNLLKSQEYALKELPDDNSYFDQLYNEIGIVHADKGNNYEAITYLQKALSLNVKKFGENIHPDKVAIHFNLGTAYANLGIKDKALFHTQKTIDMGKMAFGEDHINFHFAYSQLGRIHGGEKGVFYINKAIELLNRNPHKRHQILVSFYHIFLADIYAEAGDYDKAQQQIEKTLEIRTNIHGEENFRTLKSINRLSKNYLMQDNLDQALMAANRSINANYIDYDITSKQEFDISKMQDPYLFIEAIQIKTDINLSKYRDTKNPEFLRTSYQLSSSLDEVIRKTRNALRDPNDKLFFTGLIKTIFEKHIEICLLMQELELNDSYTYEAFEFSEKSKSNVLRELVSSNKIKDKINISSDILSLEKEIVSALSDARTQMITEVSKAETDTMKVYAYQEKIIDLFHKKDSLEQSIELNYPKYFRLKYDKTVTAVSDVQSRLNKNTSLVEFLIAKTSIFAFIINSDSYYIKTLEIDNLEQKIEKFNKGIVNQEQHLFEENASKLYHELFKPLEKFIAGKNIVIIPDEALWHLQFDLLLDDSKPSTSKYLVNNYAFSYANSATFLNETLNDNVTQENIKECLAFSFSNQEQSIDSEVVNLKRLRNSKVDLPGTRQEIKALSKIFDGNYFYGKNANEHNFKLNVSDYKITHLALHAEIDSLNPENLRILFSEYNKNPTLEDNVLFGHELYTLNIPSDLVVLSACNTGVGKINKGEGIMSIGNAFQYAGAKSLLLSRWEISDETTPVIIEQFYKNLKDGMTKSQALQQAKISYLKNAPILQSQPFYWGSFYILGNDTPVQLNNNYNYLLIIGIPLLLLILFYFYKRTSKKIG